MPWRHSWWRVAHNNSRYISRTPTMTYKTIVLPNISSKYPCNSQNCHPKFILHITWVVQSSGEKSTFFPLRKFDRKIDCMKNVTLESISCPKETILPIAWIRLQDQLYVTRLGKKIHSSKFSHKVDHYPKGNNFFPSVEFNHNINCMKR